MKNPPSREVDIFLVEFSVNIVGQVKNSFFISVDIVLVELSVIIVEQVNDSFFSKLNS